MNLPDLNIDSFLADYLNTAVWADLDESDTKINTDFTKEAKESALADINLFVSKCVETFGIEKAYELLTVQCDGYLAAHDFWLTRQHHGSGFWDKPEYYGEEESKMLSDICHAFPEKYLGHINTMRSKLTFS